MRTKPINRVVERSWYQHPSLLNISCVKKRLITEFSEQVHQHETSSQLLISVSITMKDQSYIVGSKARPDFISQLSLRQQPRRHFNGI